MSDDVLSQAEVESLLSAVGGGGGESGGGSSETQKKAAPSAPRIREKVTAYDFKRPERVGKEQMRALQTLHEGFGRNFGAALSALLRSIVEVKLTSVDQLTYSEFVFSLENPTCFNLLAAEPLEGNLILDFNPSILYPIIDRLLGGGRETAAVTRRPLTEIELRLVSRITKLFLDELRRAWENVLDLKLSVLRVESNPHLVQIVPPNEVVVLISFELTLADVRGMVSICIPYNSIERISSKLSANSWSSYGKQLVSKENIERISGNLRGSTSEVVVDLAETTITTRELITLRVGDVITTQKDVRDPLKVTVAGIPKFLAKPGSHKGQKAILVEERIDPPPKKQPQPEA